MTSGWRVPWRGFPLGFLNPRPLSMGSVGRRPWPCFPLAVAGPWLPSQVNDFLKPDTCAALDSALPGTSAEMVPQLRSFFYFKLEYS